MYVKRVFVTPELITAMLTTGYVLLHDLEITEGLPEGAVMAAIGWNVDRRAWAIDFAHASFPFVADGGIPSELVVNIQRKSATLSNSLSK